MVKDNLRWTICLLIGISLFFILAPVITCAESITENQITIKFIDCNNFEEIDSINDYGTICWSVTNAQDRLEFTPSIKIYDGTMNINKLYEYKNLSHSIWTYTYSKQDYDCSYYDNISKVINQTCSREVPKSKETSIWFNDWSLSDKITILNKDYVEGKTTSSITIDKAETKYFKIVYTRKIKFNKYTKFDIIVDGDVKATLDPYLNSTYKNMQVWNYVFDKGFHYPQIFQNNTGKLVGVPIYLNLSSSNYIAQGKMLNTCYDLRFSNISDNTYLKYEFNNRTSECNTPNMGLWILHEGFYSNSSANQIHAYINNTAETGIREDTSMWSDIFATNVYHLENGTLDSSGYDKNITLWNATLTAGVFGSGVELNKYQILNTTDYVIFDNAGEWAIEFWIYPDDVSTEQEIFCEGGQYAVNDNIRLGIHTDAKLRLRWDEWETCGNPCIDNVYSLSDIKSDKWQYVAINHYERNDGTNVTNIFVGTTDMYWNIGQNSTVPRASYYSQILGAYTQPMTFGGHNCIEGNDMGFVGKLDEIRTYSTGLSLDHMINQLVLANKSGWALESEASMSPPIILSASGYPSNAFITNGRNLLLNVSFNSNGSAMSIMKAVFIDFAYNRSLNLSEGSNYYQYFNFTDAEQGNKSFYIEGNTSIDAVGNTINNQTMIQIDRTSPDIRIKNPTGEEASTTIAFDYDINEYHKGNCSYNVTTGAVSEIGWIAFDAILNTTNFVVSSTGTTYMLHVTCNDSVGNINETNQSFSTASGGGSTPPAGGGGGGGLPVIYTAGELRFNPKAISKYTWYIPFSSENKTSRWYVESSKPITALAVSLPFVVTMDANTSKMVINLPLNDDSVSLLSTYTDQIKITTSSNEQAYYDVSTTIINVGAYYPIDTDINILESTRPYMSYVIKIADNGTLAGFRYVTLSILMLTLLILLNRVFRKDKRYYTPFKIKG